MAKAAKTCATPSCPGLVYGPGSHCPRCKTARQQAQDSFRPSRRAQGQYDAEYLRNKAIVMREEDTCWLCNGVSLVNDVADHVVGLAQGGTNERTNLRRAHRRCNAQRAARQGFARA